MTMLMFCQVEMSVQSRQACRCSSSNVHLAAWGGDRGIEHGKLIQDGTPTGRWHQLPTFVEHV
jgi:hypothetical protein